MGTLVLEAAVLLTREGVPDLSDGDGAPWWVWLGGLLGVFYLAASIILTPRLRAANTVAFVLAGQVLASMIHSIYLARLGGAALVIAGVFVVLCT